MELGRLGEQGRVIEVLRDAGEVGGLGIWGDVVHGKREHVDQAGVHSHGLVIGSSFGSGGLDGQHVESEGGIEGRPGPERAPSRRALYVSESGTLGACQLCTPGVHPHPGEDGSSRVGNIPVIRLGLRPGQPNVRTSEQQGNVQDNPGEPRVLQGGKGQRRIQDCTFTRVESLREMRGGGSVI